MSPDVEQKCLLYGLIMHKVRQVAALCIKGYMWSSASYHDLEGALHLWHLSAASANNSGR